MTADLTINPLTVQVALTLMTGCMFYLQRTRFLAACLGAQLALLAVAAFWGG